MHTLIILPTFNNERQLKLLIPKLEKYKKRVVFIDDGSSDDTDRVLEESNCLYIKNDNNMGISYSVAKGVDYALEAGYEAVILMDADGQHNPRYIDDFDFKLINNGLVMGNRFYQTEGIPTCKYAANSLGSAMVNKVFGTCFKDISCGFKGFRLTDKLVDAIKNGSGYSLVYDLLFQAILEEEKIESVNMPAIYYPGEFWYTRRSEILALIEALERYSECFELYQYGFNEFKESINNNRDFYMKVDNIEYWGFYISSYQGYMVQK